jgi:5,5'-dehydrodivanillate O-demethylase oxygenase subunit
VLSKKLNERLTRVGPGTPAGSLLRRYWFPIAAVSEMAIGRTKLLTLLGEPLVLFKDGQGKLGLVGAYCAHRRANLVYGMVEEDGLRCPYHGWKFDHAGRCLEQPFEQTVRPNGRLRERASIPGYPVQELGGLVFAYLGPAPVPLLPRWDVLVQDGVWHEIGYTLTECNWLQSMENVLDPVHVEWLHGEFTRYSATQAGYGRQPERVSHEKIRFQPFEHGIMKRRLLKGESEECDDWTTGHPMIFPTMQKGLDMLRIRVPVDDTHTAQWYYITRPRPDGQAQAAEDMPLFEMPSPRLDGRGQPLWNRLNDDVDPQDNAIFASQEPILDRTLEILGESDRGIVLYRRMLLEQIAIVEQGGEPMNVFRDPAENVSLSLDTESATGFLNGRVAFAISNKRPTFSSKYRSLLDPAEPGPEGPEKKTLAG